MSGYETATRQRATAARHDPTLETALSVRTIHLRTTSVSSNTVSQNASKYKRFLIQNGNKNKCKPANTALTYCQMMVPAGKYVSRGAYRGALHYGYHFVLRCSGSVLLYHASK